MSFKQVKLAEYRVRGDMVIRDSIPTDLPYIRSLQRQESFALGWIPEQIMHRVWQDGHPSGKMNEFSGWLLLCEVNRDPVGFCFAAPAFKAPFYGRIYQLAVQADARRYQYGTFLADVAHELIAKTGANGTTLRCAFDLPANFFWEALGYKLIGIIPEGSKVGDGPRKVRRALHKRLKLSTNTLFSIEGLHQIEASP
jgi:GNAT superfamily N-acetyltransferase